jgi:hypothetical protein
MVIIPSHSSPFFETCGLTEQALTTAGNSLALALLLVDRDTTILH